MKLDDKDNLVVQSIAIGSLLLELKNKNFIESDYFLKNYNFGFKDILRKMTLDSQGVVIVLMYIFFVIPKEVYANKVLNDEINKFIENKINDKIYVLDIDDYADNDYIKHIRNAIAHLHFVFEPERTLSLWDTMQDKNKKIYKFKLNMPLQEIHILFDEIYKLLINYYNNRQENN